MKKNYFLTMLLLTFTCTISFGQVTYPGNGNSGFGDVFGATGNIQITDDGSQISFTLTKGAGSLGNTMVIYIDSKTGGFSNTSTFTDTADALRRGISGFDGTNRSTVNFPAGFEADYAISFEQNFAGLWTLDNIANFTFITSANLSPTGTPGNATFTFDVNFDEIGITAADNFKFVATYLNDTNAFRSDEAIGDGIAGGNPGATDVTFSGDRSYPNTWLGGASGAVNDWATAANWSEGTPTATHNVYIPVVTNQPTAAGAVTINKATIAAGASLKASSTFTGNITYNVAVTDTNWHLISSPVVGEQYDNAWITTNSITSSTQDTDNRAIATYDNTSLDTDSDGAGTSDSATGHWRYFEAGGTTTFGPGVGYSMKRTSAGKYAFTGTFPDGPVTPMISTNVSDWNLIGNPYPSNMDIATFITENSTTNDFIADGFDAIYVWNGTTYTDLTTGSIQPGQAFFIKSKVDGNASITEAMQTHVTGTFYKSGATSISLAISDKISSKKTKINYLDGKTTSLDDGFDIGMFDGVASDLSIYTHLIDNNEGIAFARQALPSSDLETMVVPIGVKAATNTEITFSAEALNLPTGIKVFLEDKVTNTFTRLDEVNSEYKITLTDAVNGVGRFYLYTTQSALSVKEVALNGVHIFKPYASTIRLAGLPQGKTTVSLFNLLGKQIMTTSFEAKGVKDISLPKLATGIYFAKVQTETGKVSKKIILE